MDQKVQQEDKAYFKERSAKNDVWPFLSAKEQVDW